MEAESARRTEEVEELRKAVLEIQRRLDAMVSERAETPKVPPERVKSESLTRKMQQAQKLLHDSLQAGEPLILVFNLRGFCVTQGKIWAHETGFVGMGSVAGRTTMFFIPSEKVRENRACREELIEKFFSIFSNRNRVSLMRALVNGESKTSAALREETGLTEGQFYHHVRDLAAAECLTRGGQDQYRLSDEGKILLLIAEAVASDLGASTHLKPEEVKAAASELGATAHLKAAV